MVALASQSCVPSFVVAQHPTPTVTIYGRRLVYVGQILRQSVKTKESAQGRTHGTTHFGMQSIELGVRSPVLVEGSEQEILKVRCTVD